MNNTVKVIKATHPFTVNTNPVSDEQSSTRRVAAYCRVSTDMDEQENSYEAQCSHYDRVIRETKGWRHAGIYADEGISGTQAWKRPQFLKMIEACENREIDLVITKSISRFSRNTVDCLEFVRKLKALGIAVIFEKEGINTLEQSGEIMLTILASLAQQESQSISENIKMGLKYNAQNGKGQLNITHFFGYDRGDAPHTMVINSEQSEVVRQIYREFLEGFSPTMIAKRLNERHIVTATGNGKWYRSGVIHILTNEKYAGDLIIQKTYTPDFLTHKTVKNTGQLPKYFVQDNHDPIVPKAVFYQVQAEFNRRKLLGKRINTARCYSKNALSQKVFCGHCGQMMKRYANDEPGLSDWRCGKRHSGGNSEAARSKTDNKCTLRSVKENELRQAMVSAFNELARRYTTLVEMQTRIFNGEIKRIDALLNASYETEKTLESKLAEATETNEEMASFLRGRRTALHDNRKQLYAERAEHANKEVQVRILLELVRLVIDRKNESPQIWNCEHSEATDSVDKEQSACYDYEEFFSRTAFIPTDDLIDRTGKVIRYDNDMVQRYVESVTVLDDGYEVAFKAGITITV